MSEQTGKSLNWILFITWTLLIISGSVLIYLLSIMAVNGYWIWGGKLTISETGEVGDFVGGFIGTLINAAAFLFLYLTLKDQRQATSEQREYSRKERLETRFFELTSLHKENVNEIEYNDPIDNRKKYTGRRVFKYINDQIDSCITEINPIFADHTNGEIYTPEALHRVQQIVLHRPEIDITNWAMCDIAYTIVFFGIATSDFDTLSRHLARTYQHTFFLKVLNYVNLKPTTKSKSMRHWKLIKAEGWQQIINTVEHIETTRNYQLSEAEKETYTGGIKVLLSKKHFKYYGGHQYKLGHYFRHLFQIINYIDKQEDMAYAQKYEYIKTLRAQLSNYEQVIIFFNSLSFMGSAWELEHFASMDVNSHLITKYNLIKNMPELFLYRMVQVQKYYPDVAFEFEIVSSRRALLELRYR